MHPIIWNSPRLPDDLLEDEGFPWRFLEKAGELSATDTPSTNDVACIFDRYNASTVHERDAIDSAFVWWTGYTLATIAAMVEAEDPAKVEELLALWRTQ